MNKLVDSKDYTAVLNEWRGAHAKIWLFHVSLNRLAIALNKHGAKEYLYIVAVGCRRISGPFSWKSANISLSLVEELPSDVGDARHLLKDEGAGFELLCGGVALARGPGGVPLNPFDNFLGDESELPLSET
jgi:hypothetical protein